MPGGVLCAVLAFVWWGLFPLYFRIVTNVPPAEVLAHRIVWSALFLLITLGVRRQWAWLGPVLRSPKVLAAFTASALLIASNWMLFIWSASNGHVVDASLGYFITPLVNVLLGMTLLRERLRPAQWLALGLAAFGVAWLGWQAGRLPLIALALAASFGGYGLLRKVAVLGALEGLTLETLLLAPLAAIALAVWSRHGTGTFPSTDGVTNLWLIAFGPITAVPLLLFAVGARSMSMTALGLAQYIGPTISFGLGVLVFHEPFSMGQLAGFGFIWAALVIYSAEGWLLNTRGPRRKRNPHSQAATASGTDDRIR